MCPDVANEARPSGHLQVKGPKGRRAWFALWRDADGRHQKRLGPAHVRDPAGARPRARSCGGRRTDALQQLLSAALREPTDPGASARRTTRLPRRLAYVAQEKDRRPSTIKDYKCA
jgi:hypothetical protein